MDMPDEATRHLADDHVAWLTTITDSGDPAPNPVWIAAEGDSVIVFAEPTSRKVHNIEQRPRVSLSFSSDPLGHDIVVINGRAELDHGQKASGSARYMAKYEQAIKEELQTTVDAIDGTYSTRITIHPTKVRLTPGVEPD